jgi:AraC-like DNA-binding protein
MSLKFDLAREETGKNVRDTKIFFFDLNPRENTEIAIVTAGWELTKRDYDLNRESYPYHTIEFIEAGSGTFLIDDQDYPLEPSTVLMYQPHQQYRIRASSSKRLSKFWVSMAGKEVDHFFSKISEVGSPIIRLRDTRFMHELFQQLLDYAARYDFETSHETCLIVLKLILKRILNDHDIALQANSASYATFAKCLEYMENNVATVCSVRELAEQVGIDVSYLIRLFKRYDSESPYKHLSRLKAREAAESLLYTHKSIGAVAEELGFEDQFVFSKSFKRVYGVSPKHFRDNFHREHGSSS